MVYVLSNNNEPLIPTTRYGKVRRLLKSKLAKVIRMTPFTIKLLYDTYSKEVDGTLSLGIDIGYEYVGASVISKSKELFGATFKLRTDISEKMTTRAMYRKTRRGRLRYRPARFLNRKGLDLAPSVKHKLDSHLKIIEFIKKLLPISNTIIEIANFDIQKIEDPTLSGEDDQKGFQFG
ncbi:MAG: RRXRR domain-containing protein, partial [Proteobacteria bacterium]|nr:RRXRR domain-containing protein [Pseudomonadota bacterium]